jgi:hypothetical protein
MKPQITEANPAFVSHSPETGTDYTIYVDAPDTSASGNPFPAVLVMDGDYFFDTVVHESRVLCGAGRIPPAVIVGVGYGVGFGKPGISAAATTHRPHQRTNPRAAVRTSSCPTSRARSGPSSRGATPCGRPAGSSQDIPWARCWPFTPCSKLDPFLTTRWQALLRSGGTIAASLRPSQSFATGIRGSMAPSISALVRTTHPRCPPTSACLRNSLKIGHSRACALFQRCFPGGITTMSCHSRSVQDLPACWVRVF